MHTRKGYEKSVHVPCRIRQAVAMAQEVLGAKVVGRKKVWPFPFKMTDAAISCIETTYSVSRETAEKAARMCEAVDKEMVDANR